MVGVGRMRGFYGGGGGGGMGMGMGAGVLTSRSVKARLGVTPRVGGGGGGRGGVQQRLGLGRVRGVQQQQPLATGVKARLGGIKKRSVAGVALGEIRDARQKINFNRVTTGRIGDARQKIEEKRRKKAVMDGKLKNLKIIAPVVDHLRGSGGMTMRGQGQGFVSRSEREAMGYGGGFRSSGGGDAYGGMQMQMHMMPSSGRLTRSVAAGAGGYAATVRMAPAQDDFVLTRTIRNPLAAYGSSGMRSDYVNVGRPSGQGVARVAPSAQYGSQLYTSRGAAAREQAMEMDDDEDMYSPPPRREYVTNSDQTRILVSNLQPSVTADDIVELFSDIGQLIGARMTASGQAEVVYSRKADALKAVEAYHNRLLDGSAMRVFLDSNPAPRGSDAASYTALKSATGATMKLPAGKASSGIKIQPDVGAIHKVLFNPVSSATRGLFKGGH